MAVFEPSHWVDRGTPMPARGGSEAPIGGAVAFGDHLYVPYQGQYSNVTVGYPLQTNVRVGAIVRSADGITWTTVFDGAVAFEGKLHWMPGALFVVGGALHAILYSAGFNFVGPQAYIPAGEIILIRSTNGTTWTKVASFTSWPQQILGSSVGGANWAPALSGCAWTALRATLTGATRTFVIVGWDVFVNGTGGTYSSVGTDQFETADGGLTWTLVRHMRGTYPFVTGAAGPGPGSVLATTTDDPTDPQRWFMIGGSGGLNYSDDNGASWTPSAFFTHFPFGAFSLTARGMAAFAHGTGISGPDTKVSCDQGASFTTISGAGAIAGPVGAFVAVTHFDGLEEMLIACRDNVDSSLKTALWYTQNGGEVWVKLGTLATIFNVPSYLAWHAKGLTVLYTGQPASGGAPRVFTCPDLPTGIFTERTICPLLSPINLGVPMAPCPPPFTPVPCAASALWPEAPLLYQRVRRRLTVAPPPEILPLPRTVTCAAPLGLFVLGEHCLGEPPAGELAAPPWEDLLTGECLLEGAGVFTNVPCAASQLWPAAPLLATAGAER